ncbi:hypothetical protein GCM10010218_41240 [Streptomyces mashuensis]|uniref:Uncharacterized protein n=1 Tax=Streptomyces mashuensis TaxID=33904 RepID=A0A919B5S6_9ACTN|nr:hypothetical protein GCM10010218_41240 [Streptomyces mashuensis]
MLAAVSRTLMHGANGMTCSTSAFSPATAPPSLPCSATRAAAAPRAVPRG